MKEKQRRAMWAQMKGKSVGYVSPSAGGLIPRGRSWPGYTEGAGMAVLPKEVWGKKRQHRYYFRIVDADAPVEYGRREEYGEALKDIRPGGYLHSMLKDRGHKYVTIEQVRKSGRGRRQSSQGALIKKYPHLAPSGRTKTTEFYWKRGSVKPVKQRIEVFR